jgi:hypothetical protein
MSAGREDEIAAAANRGHLRASHADRELVIGTLKAAFVEGRLTKEELESRVAQTLGARTYADLAALTTDLPAGLTTAQPPRRAARAHARLPVKTATAATCVSLALALLATAAFLGPGDDRERLIGIALVFLPMCGLSLGGLLMLHSWLENRTGRGQLPPRPMQRSHALEGERNREPPGHGALCQARRGARARRLPGHGGIQRAVWSLLARRHRRSPATLQVTT